MSLAVLADHMASKGRGGDSMLIHMSPGEVKGLQALAEAHGGSLTINPETGLPEANFLKRLLPTIIGAALAATGIGAPMAALMVGGFEAVRTGDLSKGIMAGLGAYGGAGIGGALSNAGSLAMNEAATQATPGQTAASKIPEAALAEYSAFQGAAPEAIRESAAQAAAKGYAANLPVTDRLSAGLSGLTEKAGRDAFMQELGGTKGAFRNAYMAAAPMLAAESTKAGMPQTTTPMGKITPYVVDQYGNLRPAGSYTPAEFPGFAALREKYGAKGGLMNHYADGGSVSMSPGMLDFAQHSEPVVRMNRGGLAAFAPGGLTLDPNTGSLTPTEKGAYYNRLLGQGYSDADIRTAAGQQTDSDWAMLQSIAAGLRPAPSPAPSPPALTDVQNQARQGAVGSPQTAALSLVNTALMEGKNPATIASQANTVFGGKDVGEGVITPFTEADIDAFITANKLAAPAPAPAPAPATAASTLSSDLSPAERTVLTTPGWTSVGGLSGIAGLNQNIQNFFQQNPNISYGQVQTAANQYGVDAEDIQRAVAAGGGSGGMQRVLTQPDWKSRTGLTGLEGMNKNIQMWFAENPKATESQIRQAMQSVDINDADIMRAMGKSVSDLAYKKPEDKPPVVAPGPGTVTYGEPFTPVTQTMDQVRTTYEQGGGATKMPVITDIKPTDRTYKQNEAYALLEGYLRANPNAIYSDVVSFARRQGIPEMQAKAAFNEFRFSGLTGGSRQAYDYLMGRGGQQYPTAPFIPGGGKVSRSYAEMMGLPTTFQGKYLKPTTTDSTLPSDVPKDVPVIKNPKTGSNYSSFAAFYFDANPDVREAYETQVKGNMSADDYAKYHYETLAPAAGEKEKRKGYYPSILAAQAADPATGAGGGGATGGLAAALAGGGMSRARLMGIEGAAAAGGHLGDYSDGGRLLRGPGDGVSDSIPATIANKRPARLADGEFVVPARIVSELGNGSTEAGARKLYAMMDRVQAARRGSVGKGKVAKNTRADKYLPA